MSDEVKREIDRLRSKKAEQDRQQRERNRAEMKAKAAAEAAARIRHQHQPEAPEGAEEGVAQRWVRDNMEWETYAELWCFPEATYSDYSGSMVERANSAFLLDSYPDLFETSTGGHGTLWTGITEEKRLALSEDEFDTLQEIKRDLANYPVLDDDRLSNMETEAKSEYWEKDGRDDVRQALAEEAPSAFYKFAVEFMPKKFFDEICQGDEWNVEQNMEIETGGGVYLRIDNLIEDIPYEAFDQEYIQRMWGRARMRAWMKEARGFFEDAVNAVKPELGRYVSDMMPESQLRLVQILIDRVGDDEYDWEVERLDKWQDSLSMSYDVAERLAQVLRPGDIQNSRFQDPRQLGLRFESDLENFVNALLE